jgi:hypothetical protein
MSSESTITCYCGQQLQAKDILQHGRFPRLVNPGFVYVKYRCPRCKRLGERFVPLEEPATGSSGAPPELSLDERAAFDAMGRIELNEVVDFHFELDGHPLKALIG